MNKLKLLMMVTILIGIGTVLTSAQEKDKKDEKSKDKTETFKSIGGKEHDAEILGVKIGMDIPTALQTVFINASRKPGQEKPDAKRNEGKDNKDIRVLYKGLPQGDLQIVFAQGKFVKEIILDYKSKLRSTDLRLPISGNLNIATSGERFDDRYTIGFTDEKKTERMWWRDENTDGGFKYRVIFLSDKLIKSNTSGQDTIVRKAIVVTPGDEEKFLKAMNGEK